MGGVPEVEGEGFDGVGGVPNQAARPRGVRRDGEGHRDRRAVSDDPRPAAGGPVALPPRVDPPRLGAVMAGVPKPKPMTAFRDNMSDAHALVRLARATTTKRTYRMRRELRGRVGGALRLAQGVHDQLDCVESDDLFIVILPSSSLKRGDFEKRSEEHKSELQSLMRISYAVFCLKKKK